MQNIDKFVTYPHFLSPYTMNEKPFNYSKRHYSIIFQYKLKHTSAKYIKRVHYILRFEIPEIHTRVRIR